MRIRIREIYIIKMTNLLITGLIIYSTHIDNIGLKKEENPVRLTVRQCGDLVQSFSRNKGKIGNQDMMKEKRVEQSDITDWLLCPICSGKTRIKVRPDTVILNLPLYCPKCKRETLICVKDKKVSIVQSSAENN